LDPQFKPNMSRDEAVDLAKRAVRSAALRDSASGDGLDVLVITKDGTEEFTENIK
jgi:proteasome beta subunit